MKPVLLPQFPKKGLVGCNSIFNVAKSLCVHLPELDGRVIYPKDLGYDLSVLGKSLKGDAILDSWSSVRGPRFGRRKVALDVDEYIVNLDPVHAFLFHKNAGVRGFGFRVGDGSPKLVNYVLFAPKEVFCRREVCYNLAAFPVLFNSAHNQRLWCAELRKYISASEVRRVQRDSVVVPLGISCRAFQEFAEGQDRDPLAVSFHGRVSSDNGFLETVEIVENVRRLLPGAFLRVSTYGESCCELLRKVVEERPWIEAHYDVPRDEYRKLVWRSSFFVCCSRSESYGLSWFEQLFAGQVGVFTRAAWRQDMLPDYPFTFSGKNAGVALLKVLMTSRESALKELAAIPGWIGEEHDNEKNMRAFFGRAAELVS